MFNWFTAAPSRTFGRELAEYILEELSGSVHKRDAKFAAKASKVLANGSRRVQAFKAHESMNVYKKAKLANAFLWTLKDRGCPEDYANQLTEWLTKNL